MMMMMMMMMMMIVLFVPASSYGPDIRVFDLILTRGLPQLTVILPLLTLSSTTTGSTTKKRFVVIRCTSISRSGWRL